MREIAWGRGPKVKWSRIFLNMISILIILYFGPVQDTLLKLRYSWIIGVNSYRDVINQIMTANSGLHVLPVEVREMLSMLDKNDILTFGLSEELSGDIHILQRITESAWPRRLEPSAKHKFFHNHKDNSEKGCVEMDRGKGVFLVVCP